MDIQTTTDIGISEFVMLEMAFNEEDHCEHSLHDTSPEAHYGPGEWYVELNHSCGQTGVYLFCDKWVRYFKSAHVLFKCSHCGENWLTADEIYGSMWRKGSIS